MQYVVPPLVGSVPVYIVLMVPLFGGMTAPVHTAVIWRARAAEAFASAGAQAAGGGGAAPRAPESVAARKRA